MAPYKFTAPVLRVCYPDEDSLLGMQQYNIHFKDDAQFKQAMTALSSPPSAANTSGKSTRANSSSSSDDGSLTSSSTQETSDSTLTQATTPIRDSVERNRGEALAILEGRKIPIPNRDYGNAPYKTLYYYWACREMTEEHERRKRKPVIPAAVPGTPNPEFSWSALHKILASQLSTDDQKVLPELDEELTATVLFMNKDLRGDDDGRVVRTRADLQEKSVKFFEAMMMDVMVRGWTDLVWLGWEWEGLPDRVEGEGVNLIWGEDMI